MTREAAEPRASRPGSRDLLELLRGTRGSAGVLYEGALRVMADRANPARERMAAFALREVIEELEKEVGLETEKGAYLRDRVIDLRTVWENAPRALEGPLDGGVDIATAIDQFFADYDAFEKSRRRRAAQAIGGLDPAGRGGPPAVSDARIEWLVKSRLLFNRILHGTSTTVGFAGQMERFEDFLLGLLRPRPSESFAEIDKLLSDGPTMPRAASHVADLIRSSPANHEYFFDNVDDPGWLPVLVNAGFFKKPPEPERGEGWVRFPAWSESRYLVRIAARAPEAVRKVAVAIPSTENVRVHEDILGVAACLPSDMAAKLARREAKFLRAYDGPLMSLPDAAGRLIALLGRAGEPEPAFKLATPLLEIRRNPGRAGARQGAVASVDDWAYGRIIEQAWPALMTAAPKPAFRFLCDRLQEVVRIGFTDARGHDFSYVYRSAVESHTQNMGHSLLDTLVDHLRDIAVEEASEPDGRALVLDALAPYDEPIFRRLELHVLQQRGPDDLVTAALIDPDLGNDVSTLHEYAALLRSRFSDLTSSQREDVLAYIAAGPPGLTNAAAGAATDDESEARERELRLWRHRRYALIADQLEGEVVDTHRLLTTEFGELDEPSFAFRSSSWTGPTSPYSSEDLTAMGPAATVAAISAWQPPGGPQDPTPEGLGRSLQAAVASQPADFAASAERFQGVEATYVRGLLSGLTEAAKANPDETAAPPFSWTPVLELCGWVVAQPRAIPDVNAGWDRDPHWGLARTQVASLLSGGFAASPAEISAEDRAHVWKLLVELAEDPDPTARDEEGIQDDDRDPLTLSLNTTRGEALHAVVRYAFWVERQLRAKDDFVGMASMPEVAQLLEQHLDPRVDPSLAVRAVYGRWFAQFVRMDPAWAKTLAPLVFPAASDRGAAFDAAWNPYVTYTPPWNDVLAVLRDAYRIAIARSPADEVATTRTEERNVRLGDHLLAFRVRGLITLDDDDLFAAQWRGALPEVRARVLTETGWSLGEGPAELDEHIKQGFVETWEWIAADGDKDDATSLAGFGAWLAAPSLDGDGCSSRPA